MSTLSGNKVKDTFQSLLKLESGTASSTYKVVEDGSGNDLGVKLSTSGVEVGELKFTTDPSVSTSDVTAVVYDSTTKTIKLRDLDTSAFSGNTVSLEESFVGFIESPVILEAASQSILVFNPADNTTENSSYHFGNQPPKLELLAGSLDAIRNISGSPIIVFLDMSAGIQSANANRDITFTLSRYDGSTWNDIAAFSRTTGSSSPEVASFWGMYMLQAGEMFQIKVSSVAGGITLLNGSLFKFSVKEPGDIL